MTINFAFKFLKIKFNWKGKKAGREFHKREGQKKKMSAWNLWLRLKFEL